MTDEDYLENIDKLVQDILCNKCPIDAEVFKDCSGCNSARQFREMLIDKSVVDSLAEQDRTGVDYGTFYQEV